MFDYVNYVPNLQLLDGSCENCIRLFAALEEIMATDTPVAIVLTSDGSSSFIWKLSLIHI